LLLQQIVLAAMLVNSAMRIKLLASQTAKWNSAFPNEHCPIRRAVANFHKMPSNPHVLSI